jgi:hypothetical protein
MFLGIEKKCKEKNGNKVLMRIRINSCVTPIIIPIFKVLKNIFLFFGQIA